LTAIDPSGTLASTYVDTGARSMRTILRRWHAWQLAGVRFCDACGSACDARCRADAVADHARATALALRAGLR
jgi:hypothetical protein